MFAKLAGVGCWTGDFLTMFMVMDMMLQDKDRYSSWATGARKVWNRGKCRIVSFWVIAPIAITVVLLVVAGSKASGGVSAWDEFNKDKLYSGELTRCFMCATITLMDLFIVMQDWDFPEFDNEAVEVNLPGKLYNKKIRSSRYISRHSLKYLEKKVD